MALVPYPLNYQLCELPQNPIVDLIIPVVSHGAPILHMPRSQANQSTDILGWAGGSVLAAPQLGSLGINIRKHEWVP